MSINASECSTCAKAVVPPREICPYCGPRAGLMKTVTLNNRGSVLTHTVLHIPAEGFEAPLAMALVQLERNTVVLCLAKTEKELEVTIGDSVAVTEANDGRLYYNLVS